jgi:hypothetical protein
MNMLKGGAMRLIKTLCLITFFIVTIGTIQADARRDRDDKQATGDTWNYWVCPWCGSSQNYEDGGRHPLWYYDYHNYWGKSLIGEEPKPSEIENPITIDQAKSVLDRYIAFSENPNLRLGKIKEYEDYFEAEIITKDGSLVDIVTIDKKTGGIESIY